MAIFKIAFFIGFTIGILGCSIVQVATTQMRSAETFEVTNLQGERINLPQIFAEHDATVLVWWATKCPCVKRYQGRIEELFARNFTKKVAVFAVSSNADENCGLVAEEAARRNFKVPIIRDESGELARFAGVSTTPTAIIVGKDGQVKFVGWIDNERLAGTPNRIVYLDNALEEILSGREILLPQAPTWGCMITRNFSRVRTQV